jgi:hypothetical protein
MLIECSGDPNLGKVLLVRYWIVMMLVVVLGFGSTFAHPSWGERAGQFGLGSLGGLLGAAVAITAISEITPTMDSGIGKTAIVVGSLAVFDGFGAACGVLAAGKIWQTEGSISGCILGGLAGGLASALVEPLLYGLGVPEGITEFLGLALLPILPALGSMLGFGR